jgi:1,4-dihydroxy-2-naphthoyl-CoA hydrolase
MLWNRTVTVADLNLANLDTAAENSGIEFVSIGDDWLEATMPLDSRTKGLDGTFHPGALGILAETIGSVAASLCIDAASQICLGQLLHVNHPSPVASGPIRAKVSAVAILADSHLWDIEVKDSKDTTVCVARLTMSIINRADYRQ